MLFVAFMSLPQFVCWSLSTKRVTNCHEILETGGPEERLLTSHSICRWSDDPCLSDQLVDED